MLPSGLQPAIPASERLQAHALDRAAIGIGQNPSTEYKYAAGQCLRLIVPNIGVSLQRNFLLFLTIFTLNLNVALPSIFLRFTADILPSRSPVGLLRGSYFKVVRPYGKLRLVRLFTANKLKWYTFPCSKLDNV